MLGCTERSHWTSDEDVQPSEDGSLLGCTERRHWCSDEDGGVQPGDHLVYAQWQGYEAFLPDEGRKLAIKLESTD